MCDIMRGDIDGPGRLADEKHKETRLRTAFARTLVLFSDLANVRHLAARR